MGERRGFVNSPSVPKYPEIPDDADVKTEGLQVIVGVTRRIGG